MLSALEECSRKIAVSLLCEEKLRIEREKKSNEKKLDFSQKEKKLIPTPFGLQQVNPLKRRFT